MTVTAPLEPDPGPASAELTPAAPERVQAWTDLVEALRAHCKRTDPDDPDLADDAWGTALHGTHCSWQLELTAGRRGRTPQTVALRRQALDPADTFCPRVTGPGRLVAQAQGDPWPTEPASGRTRSTPPKRPRASGAISPAEKRRRQQKREAEQLEAKRKRDYFEEMKR